MTGVESWKALPAGHLATANEQPSAGRRAGRGKAMITPAWDGIGMRTPLQFPSVCCSADLVNPYNAHVFYIMEIWHTLSCFVFSLSN